MRTPLFVASAASLVFGCSDPPSPLSPSPAGTDAAPTASAIPPEPAPKGDVAPPPTASSATTYEVCPPGWSSGEVHHARGYAHVAFADVPAKLSRDGHFDTEATVADASKCPPCPPHAMCKPCPAPYVDLKDGDSPILHVELPPGIELEVGKRFKVSIAACAGTTPQTYQLRGYEPAP